MSCHVIVFKEQLKKAILEEVDKGKDSYAAKKHYLPHQPVITLTKETTKLCIVISVSTHYKGCPSINDVVHQGPTILPKLYGILLRFRTAKCVLISDAEKAFLQVRIEETDRDFTRRLWIKSINKPLTPENLAVYRFTRVTLSINASPFLLSATILYCLKNFVEKKELAEEIAANLCVDDFFILAETKEDAIRKYTTRKSRNCRWICANSFPTAQKL
ncbi:hypothetical protein RB195_021918 [Necator americanus]|uniref:Reverse transcriptase domain-containing protein n=1 Tax=Necator americanus TaxID=51031 RepID=A0ABR1ED90_NECAM